MEIKHITEDYAVSAQIQPVDMQALADAGFKMVINNRPDSEISGDLQSDAMRAAADAAGLSYVSNPVINGGLTQDMVENHAAAIRAANGPVFAYCRSGTRSSIVWALGQAGTRPTADIIAALANAGYQVPGLDAQIEAIAAAKGT